MWTLPAGWASTGRKRYCPRPFPARSISAELLSVGDVTRAGPSGWAAPGMWHSRYPRQRRGAAARFVTCAPRRVGDRCVDPRAPTLCPVRTYRDCCTGLVLMKKVGVDSIHTASTSTAPPIHTTRPLYIATVLQATLRVQATLRWCVTTPARLWRLGLTRHCVCTLESPPCRASTTAG